MSKFKTQPPIIHTPGFTEFSIAGVELQVKMEALGLRIPCGMLDSTYYYTNAEGWAKILADLVFKSDLTKPDKFDCDNYAMKAMSECASRYGLNAFGFVIGDVNGGCHAFNILYDGEGFWLFEPNAGFGYGGAFPIGEHGYKPSQIVI